MIENSKIYSRTQNEEFKEVLHKFNLSDAYIKKVIFGPQIMPEDMKVKSLGKMMSDLHKKLDIY